MVVLFTFCKEGLIHHLANDTLAAFIMVYDCGSFTVAAEQLGKTQAAVSIMLSRLEKMGKPPTV